MSVWRQIPIGQKIFSLPFVKVQVLKVKKTFLNLILYPQKNCEVLKKTGLISSRSTNELFNKPLHWVNQMPKENSSSHNGIAQGNHARSSTIYNQPIK